MLVLSTASKLYFQIQKKKYENKTQYWNFLLRQTRRVYKLNIVFIEYIFYIVSAKLYWPSEHFWFRISGRSWKIELFNFLVSDASRFLNLVLNASATGFYISSSILILDTPSFVLFNLDESNKWPKIPAIMLQPFFNALLCYWNLQSAS